MIRTWLRRWLDLDSHEGRLTKLETIEITRIARDLELRAYVHNEIQALAFTVATLPTSAPTRDRDRENTLSGGDPHLGRF